MKWIKQVLTWFGYREWRLGTVYYYPTYSIKWYVCDLSGETKRKVVDYI